jgi:hypothetical protein
VIEHKIIQKNLKDLKPAPYNPRTISDQAMKGLAASLEKFGLVQPIIWNKQTNRVVGGHQRVAVLIERGEETAQCVEVDLAEKDEMELNVALNNLNGDWDFDGLRDLLQKLNPSPDQRVLMGYSETELSTLLKFGEEMTEQADKIGLTPDERKQIYDNNAIKQIVLYFETSRYADVLTRMKEIADRRGLESNSDVFEFLLALYERNRDRDTEDAEPEGVQVPGSES